MLQRRYIFWDLFWILCRSYRFTLFVCTKVDFNMWIFLFFPIISFTWVCLLCYSRWRDLFKWSSTLSFLHSSSVFISSCSKIVSKKIAVPEARFCLYSNETFPIHLYLYGIFYRLMPVHIRWHFNDAIKPVFSVSCRALFVPAHIQPSFCILVMCEHRFKCAKCSWQS